MANAISRTGAEVLSAVRRAGTEIAPTIGVAEAVAALEAWIEQHSAILRVRRGHLPDAARRLEEAYGKLHPLHALLVERFGGFLELSIDPAYCPALRHGDGLRVLGIAEAYPRCDIATQLPRYRTLVEAAAADEAMKELTTGWKEKIPALSTLEGVVDSWVGNETELEAFTEGRIAGSERFRGLSDRRKASLLSAGPPFALVAELIALEDRLVDIDRWKRVERVAAELGSVRFDALGRLEWESDPDILIDLVEGRCGGYVVSVLCELGPIPTTNAWSIKLFKRGLRRANERAYGVRALDRFVNTNVLWGCTALLYEGLVASELARAVARLRSYKASFEGGESGPPFDLDDAEHSFPENIVDVLRASEADPRGFTRRFAQPGKWKPRVECVGTREPRVRWSCVGIFDPDTVDSGSSNACWHPVLRPEGPRFELELPSATLTRSRIETAFALLDPGIYT